MPTISLSVPDETESALRAIAEQRGVTLEQVAGEAFVTYTFLFEKLAVGFSLVRTDGGVQERITFVFSPI